MRRSCSTAASLAADFRAQCIAGTLAYALHHHVITQDAVLRLALLGRFRRSVGGKPQGSHLAKALLLQRCITLQCMIK